MPIPACNRDRGGRFTSATGSCSRWRAATPGFRWPRIYGCICFHARAKRARLLPVRLTERKPASCAYRAESCLSGNGPFPAIGNYLAGNDRLWAGCRQTAFGRLEAVADTRSVGGFGEGSPLSSKRCTLDVKFLDFAMARLADILGGEGFPTDHR